VKIGFIDGASRFILNYFSPFLSNVECKGFSFSNFLMELAKVAIIHTRWISGHRAGK
jgi:hypothetical protein